MHRGEKRSCPGTGRYDINFLEAKVFARRSEKLALANSRCCKHWTSSRCKVRERRAAQKVAKRSDGSSPFKEQVRRVLMSYGSWSTSCIARTKCSLPLRACGNTSRMNASRGFRTIEFELFAHARSGWRDIPTPTPVQSAPTRQHEVN